MGLFAGGAGPQGKPDDAASLPHTASAAAALESASTSTAADSALAPCWKCGVPNGRTASFCWGCEADLAEAGPFRFAAEPEPAPDMWKGAEPPAGLSSAADALADPMPLAAAAPVQQAVQAAVQHAVQPHADAGAAFPVLTSVVDADGSVPALLLPAAPPRRRRPELAVLIACLALAGSGAYLLFPTPDVVAVTAPAPAGNTAKAGGFAARAQADAKPNAAPPQPEASNASRPQAVQPLVVDAPVAAVGQAPAVLAFEPGALPPTQAGPMLAAAAKRPVAAVARPSAARPAIAAANTVPRAGTARPANPAAARPQPNPSAVEPARPLPAPLGPCTSTVAALGLCSATPTQPKE